MGIIEQFLTPIIDRFKLKNPFAFAIMVVALLIAAFTIETVSAQQVCTIGADNVQTCVNLLSDNLIAVLDKVRWGLLALTGIVGAHTPSKDGRSNAKSSKN